MRPNIKALIILLNEEFKGNQSAMARAFGVSKEHIYQVLKSNGGGAGAVFCGGVIKWCNDNGRDYNDYIFLK